MTHPPSIPTSHQQTPDLIWIGWAGYLFQAPRQFRLARVQGDYLKGGLALADDDRIRIELTWTYIPNRGFNLESAARKRLGKSASRFNSPLGELFYITSTTNQSTRVAGYSPTTRRLIEFEFHPATGASPSDNETFWKSLTQTLIDQSRTEPMKWSFFDCSFITPPGFLYADATLNLGDMTVRLMTGTSEKTGPTLSVRQIYPATLALARQPLDAWLRDWDKVASTRYIREGAGMWGRKPAVVRKCQTPIGEGCSTKSKLRRGLSLLYWKMGKAAEAQMVEDKISNRLIGVRAADHPDRVSSLISDVLANGLHWAR